MTRAYFDTSCIAKCYVHEAGTDAASRVAASASSLHCSTLGRVELVSMLARACRDRRLSRRNFRTVIEQLTDDERRLVWDWIAVSPAVIEDARLHLADIGIDVPLSGADAIHLSTARLGGFGEIWSTDRRLLEAATHFGLEGRDPNE